MKKKMDTLHSSQELNNFPNNLKNARLNALCSIKKVTTGTNSGTQITSRLHGAAKATLEHKTKKLEAKRQTLQPLQMHFSIVKC